MAFASIAGITVEVDVGSFEEMEPEIGGEDVYAQAGNLRSVVSWTRRKWALTTGWMTQADFNTLKAAIAGGALVPVTGDAFDNANITCRVKLGAAPFIDIAGTSFNRQAHLTILEV